MNANGLTLCTIKTLVKPGQAPLVISQNEMHATVSDYIETRAAYFVAYLDYKVIIGAYQNGTLRNYEQDPIDPKYVQRLRVFNQDEELLLWRSGDGFKGRCRKDGEGDEVDVVDAKQVLFGTDARAVGNGGYSEIFEERGTRLVLPFENLQVNEAQKRIALKTRNYIDYNAAHQATYVDCRFVGFADHNGDLQ
jgi:CRISPR-associated protein (TIGR03984 family)